MMRRPGAPGRNCPIPCQSGVILYRLRPGNVGNSEGGHICRRRQMRPMPDRARYTLMQGRNAGRAKPTVQHKMKAAEVNDDGLVRVAAAGVLGGIGVHRQLMNLAE